MSDSGRLRTPVKDTIAALRRDLIHEDGPRISTMRNYRFAIVQYDPRDEFELRSEVQSLSAELISNGWMVLSIDLQKLLFERLRKDPEELERLLAREKRATQRNRDRGLNFLKDKLGQQIEGLEGLAGDCSQIIREYADAHPDEVDRTVALIGRAGALYPFFRSSALLKHLDGRTRNVPVVLLYPGERRGDTGLAFMGLIEPDKDYRPRIYP